MSTRPLNISSTIQSPSSQWISIFLSKAWRLLSFFIKMFSCKASLGTSYVIVETPLTTLKKRKQSRSSRAQEQCPSPMTPLTTLRTAQLFQMSCPLISSTVGIRIGSTAAAWLAGSYIWPSRFGIFAGGGVRVSPEQGSGNEAADLLGVCWVLERRRWLPAGCGRGSLVVWGTPTPTRWSGMRPSWFVHALLQFPLPPRCWCNHVYYVFTYCLSVWRRVKLT